MMLTSFECSEFVSELHLFDVCRCATYTCCTFFAVEGFSVVHTSAGVFFIHVLAVCRGYVVLALAHFVAALFCTIIGIHILVFRLFDVHRFCTFFDMHPAVLLYFACTQDMHV
jgi:hypothetical protein